jgi:hypothetical protein
MAGSDGFLIGNNLRDKLKEVITKVDALPTPGTSELITERHEEGYFAEGDTSGTWLGTFDGSWAKDATKTVVVVEPNTETMNFDATGETATVWNFLAAVNSDNDTGKKCLFSVLQNGVYVLIAAEC